MTKAMNRDDRLDGVIGKPFIQSIGTQPSIVVAVYKVGGCSAVGYGVSSCDKSESRNGNLIPSANPDSQESKMQSGSATCDRDNMRNSCDSCDSPLELLNVRPMRYVPGRYTGLGKS